MDFPSDCCLRSAKATDQGAIRKLVLSAFLDPTQLRWSQFWVIEHGGDLIACGQLRSFPDAQELGSLVVKREWRDRGLGTYLTQHLIQQATQPVYLECVGKGLAQFYTRLGFVPVAWSSLPPALKRKFTLSALASRWLGLPITLLRYQQK